MVDGTMTPPEMMETEGSRVKMGADIVPMRLSCTLYFLAPQINQYSRRGTAQYSIPCVDRSHQGRPTRLDRARIAVVGYQLITYTTCRERKRATISHRKNWRKHISSGRQRGEGGRVVDSMLLDGYLLQ